MPNETENPNTIEVNQVEIKCPLISNRVVCDNCGSPNFNVDISPRRGKKIPGRCDECGHTQGVRTS